MCAKFLTFFALKISQLRDVGNFENLKVGEISNPIAVLVSEYVANPLNIQCVALSFVLGLTPATPNARDAAPRFCHTRWIACCALLGGPAFKPKFACFKAFKVDL